MDFLRQALCMQEYDSIPICLFQLALWLLAKLCLHQEPFAEL